MILKKGLLATIAASSLLGNALLARDVESTKESSSFLQRLFPEAYSSMSIMHHNSSNAAKNRWQLRYNLGSTFLDEKLDNISSPPTYLNFPSLTARDEYFVWLVSTE